MPVTPPRPKGPPLNALRAFEAAARLGGFSRAAEELSVTPGAITQHIKALEDWVGVRLFERRSQGVQLTQAGRRLQPEFTSAFDQLGQAVHALREVSENPVIHIAALPSVAQLWLSPRLPKLRKQNPRYRFSVTALEQPPNLLRDLFDWSVFFEEPTGQHDEVVLEHDEIYPVCAPSLASSLVQPSDLDQHHLIMDQTWANDWDVWAHRAGWNRSPASVASRFSLYALAVEEARNGAGVLMGHASLVQDDIEAGRLVAPFAISAQTGQALILRSSPRSKRLTDSLVTFR